MTSPLPENEAVRRLHAQYAVARALAESSSLGEAAPRVLRAICEALGWDHGGLWRIAGAAGVLRDALLDASPTVQVVVTSHSPDLLDDQAIRDNWILGVVNEKGETKIGPIDEAGRSAIRDRLYTAGELLRLNQLTPDLQEIEKTALPQLELFGEIPK